MTYQDQDYQLWNTWKESKNKKDLSNLLNNMKPLIYSNIKPLRGAVSDGVLESEANLQAVNAFKSYNPSRATKLSTHVTNQLKKVNRIVYNNMELLSIPEARRIKFKNYEAVTSYLTDELGRPPTTTELADELGWSHAEVRRFKAESYKELSDSAPTMHDVASNSDPNQAIVSYVYNDLSPTHQNIFELVGGYSGIPKQPDEEIIKKLKITRGQLSYAKTKIKKKLKEALGQHGG